MMQASITSFLGASFRRGANEEAHRHALHQHKMVQDRERRQKQDEARNDAADLGDLATSVVTAEQAEVFQLELDAYQTATVEALIENEQALELLQDRLDNLMREAHILDDGRRVFKTEDGLRVFDEFGNELDNEIVTPDEINDRNPRWETVSELIDQRNTLQIERSQLLDYQTDLDVAAEQLDSGMMTVDEYDELREGLRQTAPGAVRNLLGSASDPENNTLASAPSIDLNLDAKLATAIQPLAPGFGR